MEENHKNKKEQDEQKESDNIKTFKDAKEDIIQKLNIQDNLDEKKYVDTYVSSLDDPCLEKGQEVALYSVCGPEHVIPKNGNWAMRLWKVFPKFESDEKTLKVIQDHIQEIRKKNTYAKQWDFYTMEMGGWAPFPPALDMVQQTYWAENKLQEIMDESFKNQKEARNFMRERINETKEQEINKIIAQERQTRLRKQREKILIDKLIEKKRDFEKEKIKREIKENYLLTKFDDNLSSFDQDKYFDELVDNKLKETKIEITKEEMEDIQKQIDEMDKEKIISKTVEEKIDEKGNVIQVTKIKKKKRVKRNKKKF